MEVEGAEESRGERKEDEGRRAKTTQETKKEQLHRGQQSQRANDSVLVVGSH
jgi:hypothetical protein